MKIIKNITLALVTTSSLFSASLNMQGGDVIGKNIYGVINDYKGLPIVLNKMALLAKESSYSGFIHIKGEDKEQDFILSSFSSKKGIGTLYLTKTKLNEDNITVVDTNTIDLSSIGGVYSPTKGFKTLWNTYLFTQDKLVDGNDDKKFISEFSPYFQNKINMIDSYKYGWAFEAIVLNTKGDAKVINHFALGRTFASDIVLMPDNKTLYMFDGKYSKNLYMFISDKEEDFISGTLYVAKKTKNSIQWIELAQQNSLKLKLKLRRDLKFSSLYKSHKPKNNTCKKNYTFVDTVYGKECLSVSKRSKKQVGIFEPIREAARLGVISDFQDITSITYENESQMLIFKKQDSVVSRFSANNKMFNSNYTIK
jgi:hypothetical protein